MCRENKKDIDEIPEKYRSGVTFHYVENVQDVWDFALTDEIVDNPVDLTVDLPGDSSKGRAAEDGKDPEKGTHAEKE